MEAFPVHMQPNRHVFVGTKTFEIYKFVQNDTFRTLSMLLFMARVSLIDGKLKQTQSKFQAWDIFICHTLSGSCLSLIRPYFCLKSANQFQKLTFY